MHLLTANALGYLILLLTSIIIFRTVDKSFYGLYVILLSLFAVIELLMAGFNEVIVRFLNDKISIKKKQSILLFVLCYKYILILLFILIILFAKWLGVFEFLIGDHAKISDVINSYLLVVILNGILSTLIGVNSAILNSQKKYKLTTNIGLIRNLSYFIAVLILSFNTQNYLHYLYCGIVLGASLVVFLSINIYLNFREFFILNLIKSKFSIQISKKYIFPYVLPLSASSLLTYSKNHLPIIILGKEFDLENVAVFSIIKTFFKALHSVSGSFIEPMMSKFLEMKANVEEFSSNMKTIFLGTLLLRLGSFLILLILINHFFLIYKIENSLINQFVFYVLGLEYLLAGMIVIYGLILRLGESTINVFRTSLARFVVEISLIFFFLLEYGIMGAALILLIARYVETLVAYFFVKNHRFFNFSGALIICFFFIILYCLLQLLKISQ